MAGGGADTASPSPLSSEVAVIRYVALGDSYTIGTSVAEEDRWPNQLAARLAGDDPRLELVANLGVNGYTSADLIADELPEVAALDPGFVTVLIGVNDVVQGVPEDDYARNVDTILDRLLVDLPPDRILAISTPDYTVTPGGAAFGDPVQQSEAIRRNNEILRAAAESRGIGFVDIRDVSLRAAEDRSLVADDGLHPSGAQYALWVERILPSVQRLLHTASPTSAPPSP